MTAALLLARAHWKLIGIGLLCLALAVQSVRLGHAHNRLEKERINSNELRAELKRISTAKNEQALRTKGTVEQADRGNREADERARRVEDAPLPGDCKTPDAVRSADI